MTVMLSASKERTKVVFFEDERFLCFCIEVVLDFPISIMRQNVDGSNSLLAPHESVIPLFHLVRDVQQKRPDNIGNVEPIDMAFEALLMVSGDLMLLGFVEYFVIVNEFANDLRSVPKIFQEGDESKGATLSENTSERRTASQSGIRHSCCPLLF